MSDNDFPAPSYGSVPTCTLIVKDVKKVREGTKKFLAKSPVR